ncbi:hypothetical protein HYR99_41940 [Candidatus Poribacteria bacterium]|nr:hypothetical protein [Candidatus Poribacteria bacterium]
MNADYAALAGRIQQLLMDVERVVSRAELLMNKAQGSGDDGYLDGVALNLHGFYAGVERIFEDIARNVDKAVPGGPEWHQDLLLQMSAEVASIRPPVITQETRHCLDDYRGFRHVVRNVYTFNLRPTRLQELTADLRRCYQAAERDLGNFVGFLESPSETGEST